MKRIVIASAVLVLGAAGAGVSLASPPNGGPQTFGTCTAYFSGSQTGQDHKHKAGPFAGLEQASEDAEQGDATKAGDDLQGDDTAQDVQDYCANYGPGGK